MTPGTYIKLRREAAGLSIGDVMAGKVPPSLKIAQGLGFRLVKPDDALPQQRALCDDDHPPG